MSTLTLGNIGQLPKAEKPAQGVNYAALTADVVKLRCELPQAWEQMQPQERGRLYSVALERVEQRPQLFKTVSTFPRIWRAYRAGTLTDFLDYSREVHRFLDAILALSENENPELQAAFSGALESILESKECARLRTKQERRDYFSNL